MTILSGKTLREYAKAGMPLVSPFVSEKTVLNGMSYGCSLAGYDIRLREELVFFQGDFFLGSSIEEFNMPRNVVGFVHDKSSWARKGLSLFNTVIEPGWKGFLTLEMVYHKQEFIQDGEGLGWNELGLKIPAGSPIAQIIFMHTDEVTEGYNGKYQNQRQGPQDAIYEQADLFTT